jgi:ribose transport system permease protein
VLGGTSLAGGTGSAVATVVGAVFLTQLQQVLTANGAALSIEFIIQGAIIALGMLLRTIPWQALWQSLAVHRSPPTPAIATSASERDP